MTMGLLPQLIEVGVPSPEVQPILWIKLILEYQTVERLNVKYSGNGFLVW